MRKWIYVLCPVALLGLFIFYYSIKSAEVAAREKAKAELVASQKAADAAARHDIEEKARLDAAKRAADRLADAAKKDALKAAKYNDTMAKLRDETDKANAQVAELTDKIAQLQFKLDALQKAKEDANQSNFDIEKQTELALVQKGNADLQSERMVDAIAERADRSFLTKLPPPPPTD
jgi:predicted  nucleic acid-binding Zn-ribbon protein